MNRCHHLIHGIHRKDSHIHAENVLTGQHIRACHIREFLRQFKGGHRRVEQGIFFAVDSLQSFFQLYTKFHANITGVDSQLWHGGMCRLSIYRKFQPYLRFLRNFYKCAIVTSSIRNDRLVLRLNQTFIQKSFHTVFASSLLIRGIVESQIPVNPDSF